MAGLTHDGHCAECGAALCSRGGGRVLVRAADLRGKLTVPGGGSTFFIPAGDGLVATCEACGAVLGPLEATFRLRKD